VLLDVEFIFVHPQKTLMQRPSVVNNRFEMFRCHFKSHLSIARTADSSARCAPPLFRQFQLVQQRCKSRLSPQIARKFGIVITRSNALKRQPPSSNAGADLRPRFTPNREFLARTYLRLGRNTEPAAQRDTLKKMAGSGHVRSRLQKFYLDKRRHDEEARILARLDSLP